MELTNGFCEMSEKEMMELGGGGFWDVVGIVESFLVNRLIWTNAKYMYNNFYTPIVPPSKQNVYIV